MERLARTPRNPPMSCKLNMYSGCFASDQRCTWTVSNGTLFAAGSGHLVIIVISSSNPGRAINEQCPEKAPTRAFSLSKAPTSLFAIKNLLTIKTLL